MGVNRNKLAKLIEVLTVTMQEPPWADFEALVRLVDSIAFSPELEKLSNDELRALEGFRVTLYRARDMETSTMLKHVAAHWLGTVEQAIRKLPIATEAVARMSAMMAYPSDQIAHGFLPSE